MSDPAFSPHNAYAAAWLAWVAHHPPFWHHHEGALVRPYDPHVDLDTLDRDALLPVRIVGLTHDPSGDYVPGDRPPPHPTDVSDTLGKPLAHTLARLSARRDTINATIEATRIARKERAAQRTKHQEILTSAARSEWVMTHGTPEQQARHQAGVLPADEVYLAVRNELFGPLDGFDRYSKITAQDLHDKMGPKLLAEVGDPVEAPQKLTFTVDPASELSANQWAVLITIKERAPSRATIEARRHVARFEYVGLVRYSVRVSVDWHGKPLTRVYALPDYQSPGAADERAELDEVRP